MRHVFSCMLLNFCALAFTMATPAHAQEEAREVLQRFIDDIQTIWVPLNMQPGAPYDSRRAWTQNVIDTRFDFTQMSSSSLGTRWRQISEENQAEYRELFNQVMVETVIDWLDGYIGETFEVLNVRQTGRNTEVQTRFVQINGRPITVTWVTRETNGRYLFRDVRISGVSMIADFRGRHQLILDRDGIDALFDSLAEYIAVMRRRQS